MQQGSGYTGAMDRLWTPWRYAYISGGDGGAADIRQGIPKGLEGWSGEDTGCVFCNLIRAVEWGLAEGRMDDAERLGLVVARLSTCFVCLNAFPYSSGHVMVVPYRHTDSLAKLPAIEAEEMIRMGQTMESTLREVYHPDGINLGMNLGEAAGAGVASHLHLHVLPRWFGDTNFMTTTAETRILPETLEITWSRLRSVLNRESTLPQIGMFAIGSNACKIT